jgi:hypothetical protein
MSRRLSIVFLAAGLLTILTTGIVLSRAHAGAGGFPSGGGFPAGGIRGGGFPAGGIPIYPSSAPSEGLCAKVGELAEGATPVMEGHLSGLAMGYIDTTGQWAISPRFRRAEAFSRGIARVQDADDQPYYYIDRTGKRVSDELVERTQAGLVQVTKNPMWGIDPTTGERVPIPAFVYNSQRGFADPETGEIVVETKYNEVRDFSEGLAVVLDYSTRLSPNEPPVYRWCWIDYTGREVVAMEAPYLGGYYWAGVGSFSEGLAAVAKEVGGSGVDANAYKYGYIDRTGKFAIEPRFDRVGDFHNGRAEVCIDDKWGFIDRTGKVVIPLEYGGLRSFSEGLAAVQLTPEKVKEMGFPPVFGGRESVPGWWGYINLDGELVIPFQYQVAEPFTDGMAYVEGPELRGYIDPTGKIAFDLTVVDWNVPEPASTEQESESSPQPASEEDAAPVVQPPRRGFRM